MTEKDYTKREHDMLFDEIRDTLKRIEDKQDKASERITVLELWRENTLGKFTVISIAIGIGITTFTVWLTGHFK